MPPAHSLIVPIYRQRAVRVVGLLSLLPVVLLLVFLPLRPLVALTAVTMGLLILVARPWFAWVALGLILPVSSSIVLGPLRLTDLLVTGTFGLWFIDGVRRRNLTLQSSALLLPLSSFAAVLFLSLLQATNLGEATTELLKWVQFALVLLLMPTMLPRQKTQWLLSGLLLGAASQALLGIYQFIFRIGPEWFIIMERFMRASGSFNQPNPYGGYLGLSLPIALSLALWSLHRLWQKRQHPTFNLLLLALFYSGVTGLIAAGLLVSWSRGGWLGAIGSTVVVLFLRSRRSALWGAVALLLLLAALLFGTIQPQRIPAPIAERFEEIPAYLGMTDLLNQPVTDENFAIIERLAHWEAAIRMWESAPWLGVGPGNYATIYPEVNLPRWEEALGHAHNIYLNLLAESGLVGLVTYLLFWGSIFVWLWRCRQQAADWWHAAQSEQEDGWTMPLIIGVIGMVCHLSIHNFFDNLFVQGIYLHIALSLATVETLMTGRLIVFKATVAPLHPTQRHYMDYPLQDRSSH